jgi:hypothetical protein
VIAVCCLTLSLATRYYSPGDVSNPSVKTIEPHATPDAKRQRLAKNATWMPPVFTFIVMQVPRFHLTITSAQPLVRSRICEKSLYNRPPPVFTSFS